MSRMVGLQQQFINQNGIIIWEIISMKQSFLKELKNIQTITVRDLQSKLKQRNKHRGGDQNCPHTHLTHTSSDLNIISPFYQRITHKPDCTCKYHQRLKAEVPKIKKMRTEPNEGGLPTIRVTMPPQGDMQKHSDRQLQALFDDWRAELSADDLKRFYFEYLKTLPSFDKVKRLDKLDCHNLAFEQFLKNNYLVILKREKKEEKDKSKSKQKEVSVRPYKSSQKMLHKVYTQGSIECDLPSELNPKKEGFSYKDTAILTPVGDDSMKDGMRLKKLGMKSTGKTLQFIDEEQIKSRKEDNKRKKAKFMNSRPSFFGLIEDQQLLRQLCMKLMNENKRVNKQAQLMVRQLVDSDVEMYEKMIGDIEEDLEAGIKLRNLNSEEASMLIKIVLNKIQRQTQMSKSRDQHYEHKNSLIDDLCNRFGWPKDEKIVELKEFWKMRQEKQNSSLSRNSLLQQSSKNRISRSNLDKDNKKIKSKVKIKEQSRMSGFQMEKSPSKVQNSVKFVDVDPPSDANIEEPKLQEFKFGNMKPLSKIGIFNRKERPAGSKFSTENESRGMRGSKKPFGTSFKVTPREEVLEQLQEVDDVVIELETNKSIRDQPSSLDSRNSSMYLNLKNQVQRHIQLNKRFLKRIEHNLIDNQCQRLVIGMGEGIITKKRKIRAIHQALQNDTIKQSDYYTDILKYLEIYEDYCDLVIKNKREKKTVKIEQQQVALPTEKSIDKKDKQMEEEEQDLCLLMDLLKNERQLKFIDLNLLREEQDPKEELILKIPQYITKVESRPKHKKPIYDRGSVDSNRSNQSDYRKYECAILQKDLGETVTVECSNNWTLPSNEYDYTTPEQQSAIDFQSKMLRFRTALRLTDKV